MSELLTSGIELMLIGMGMVYAFLAMLVVAIGAMSSLVQRWFHALPTTPIAPDGPADKAVIAAITAAIHQYRKKHS